MRWFRIVSVVVGIALSLSLALAAQAGASGIGNAGDDLRTGWYPAARRRSSKCSITAV